MAVRFYKLIPTDQIIGKFPIKLAKLFNSMNLLPRSYMTC